jgi:hypothetical protein
VGVWEQAGSYRSLDEVKQQEASFLCSFVDYQIMEEEMGAKMKNAFTVFLVKYEENG